MPTNFKKAFLKAQEINSNNKLNMVAVVKKRFGRYKVIKEPIDLIVVISTLDSIKSYQKGFNPNKRHNFGY